MHLQENTLFELGFGVNVRHNVAEYPPPLMAYAPAKFEIAMSRIAAYPQADLVCISWV